MAYTEIQERNKKKYYYRVISVRKGKKVLKKRKYLGIDLSDKELNEKEKKADKNLCIKREIKKNVIEELKPKIIEILKKNKIKKAGIFGSYVRGEQKKNSDIDILIEPTKGMGLEFVGVKLELEDELGRKIDLVTYKGIHPLIKKKILKEEVRII
jgi:hypothetical protein